MFTHLIAERIQASRHNNETSLLYERVQVTRVSWSASHDTDRDVEAPPVRVAVPLGPTGSTGEVAS